ncbi:hypothetical protein BDQ12DRAFT_712645 [Crucibulum laeve]|uniref:DUF829-domain-containing protein n=1 Tax=Crucibulum laeve TaxID=68775 RepID=A0A5C3MC05_9AGAR|nr:hypothetical protein BDQ12DRAFT_712645 [Crucibulum laeve]
MSASSATKLHKLNSRVFISEPGKIHGSTSASNTSPSVVIIFGWMEAQLKHVRKYADEFRATFPTATIIVVMLHTGFYWCTQKVNQTFLAPVSDILRREQENGNISKGVLLHVMSNGGGFQFMTLRKMLLNSASKSATPPQDTIPTALVLDSTPGDDGLQSTIQSTKPRNPLLRIIVVPVVALLYGLFYTINSIVGNRPIFEQLRSSYIEIDILPSITTPADPKTTPRLYIYSKADTVTLERNVERGIDDAISLGLDVAVEKYDASLHVAHAREDPERYWNSIRDLWSRAIEGAEKRRFREHRL